jgi:capsular exopolysaccharide synthesis family protein
LLGEQTDMAMKTEQKTDHSIPGRYVEESPEGTEFRRLAKRVLDLCPPIDSLALMVTSSMRGEGKTTVASHLAISLARRKKKDILLVDGDLRRAQIHRLFGFNRQNGLAEYLEDKIPLQSAFKSTATENLKVITGGRLTSNPSKLFDHDRLTELIGQLKAQFDIVIFDFPPTIPVSEPEVVGKLVDGVLFVFLAGKTPREVGQRGISILEKAQANILGVVVNDLPEVLPYHYRYKYYKYYTNKSETSTVHRKSP